MVFLYLRICFVGREDALREPPLGELPSDVSAERECSGVKIKRFEVEQRAREIIFIPSGWHHQVHNMASAVLLWIILFIHLLKLSSSIY